MWGHLRESSSKEGTTGNEVGIPLGIGRLGLWPPSLVSFAFPLDTSPHLTSGCCRQCSQWNQMAVGRSLSKAFALAGEHLWAGALLIVSGSAILRNY